MKFNKNHVLFPAVILIWGLIGYQIYKYMDEPDTSDIYAIPKKGKREGEAIQKTYTLIGNYRDPFVRGRRKSNNTGATPQAKRKAATSTPASTEASVDWSSISYYGAIENNRSKAKIALIHRQGKSTIVKEGETFDGFRVVIIWKDSVKIQYATQYKVLRKLR
jgi:hypothetical protein